MVFQAEGCIHFVKQADGFLNNIFNLFGHHKDVGIILREAAYTEQTVQCAAQFVAVYKAKFANAQRQFAVAVRMGTVKQHAAGAVHRFYGVICFINFGEVHIVAVMVPVSAAFPQSAGKNHRGLNFVVTVAAVYFAPVINKGVFNNHAVGMEEREARAFILNAEQIEFFAEFAVVALGGFFQHVQVSVKFFFAGESGAVNTLEHFVVLVAAPVSAGNALQLKGFNTAGRGAVRACA